MKQELPNLSYIKELSDGDEEFEKHLIGILRKTLPIEKQLFLQNIEEKKYKDSSKIVHKIKHKISILGLEKNYDFAVSFEEDLKQGDCSQLDTFMVVLQKMEEFLTQI